MRSPLGKRQLRMLKTDWKKYAVLFLLLVLTIGFVAGMFVANDSMETAALEAYEKYNIEHGHFELKDEATQNLLDDYEKEGIQVYRQFYKELDEDADLDGARDAGIRLFIMREEVNRACLMEGAFPKGKDEIVIDRMHADNVGIHVGDEISVGGQKFKVSGFIASSDYSTLYENPTDLMFDAITFNIGFMTKEGYETIKSKQFYEYAYKFDENPADDEEQKAWADELVEKLAVLAATGGYTDDKDEAQKLEDDIEEWTDYLEGIQEKADRAESLQKELEAEEEELKKQASDQQKIMEILTKAGYGMEQIVTMSEAQIAEIVQKALISDEMQAKIDELTALADELKAEEEKINETADKLKELEKYEDDRNEITAFLPEYANQAIHFAPNDMGSDKAMGEELLIILVAILAFIFAVTVNNTIVNDAAVIGTLRASGYTRGELLRHYTALPITVSILAALIGNILGYSVLKNVVVMMYYNSYSLPTYVTLWNGDAFVKTTIVPVALVVFIILFVVSRKLRISPLKFLRHDLSTSKRKKAVKLPGFKFLTRFRIRIFLQSIGDYLMLFVGVCFVALLMDFSIGLPSTLNHYSNSFSDMMLSKYQYILKNYQDSDKNIITTKTPDAEKFSMNTVKTTDGVHVGEDISVYGTVENSIYFPDMAVIQNGKAEKAEDVDASVIISDPYVEKFGIRVGDVITLKASYESTTYRFYVADTVDYDAALAIFMPQDVFNEIFDYDKDYFTGYMTNEEIMDIDEEMIIQKITVDDYNKIVRQLEHSMGEYMNYFAVVCVGMAALLIYLLTKLIIEKNAVSISMLKVLGYRQGEIYGIYIFLTSVVIVISAIGAIFVARAGIDAMWHSVLERLNGWFGVYMSTGDALKVFGLILIAYVIVAVFDVRRIRRVPMTEALKNVE